ncbi:hypothetical protein L9F63_013309, partial [Diploptera punctata]
NVLTQSCSISIVFIVYSAKCFAGNFILTIIYLTLMAVLLITNVPTVSTVVVTCTVE